MTAHDCQTFDPNCWRCELNLDEIGWENSAYHLALVRTVTDDGERHSLDDVVRDLGIAETDGTDE